jgi:hypothetical protein
MGTSTVSSRLIGGLGAFLLVAGCSLDQASSQSAASARATTVPSAGPTIERSTSPSPVVTSRPGPYPTLGPEPQWQRLAEDKVFNNSSARAVAASPAGYVVVGISDVPDGGAPSGAAWTSADGRTWQQASGSWAVGQPDGVIYDRIGFVAWGHATGPVDGSANVWFSRDGLSWVPANPTPSFRNATLVGVARLGDQLFAVGYPEVESSGQTANRLQAWSSVDGLTWEPVNPVTSSPWNGSLEGMVAAGGALEAWGYAISGTTYPPVTLRSSDGLHWEVGGAGLKVVDYMREGIGDVVMGGDHLVAVGHGLLGEAGSPPPPAAAWTSIDGLAWTPATFLPEPSTGFLSHVEADRGGYVALGSSGLETIVWRSTDGRTWTQASSAPDAGRDGEENGCTGGPCPYTAVTDFTSGPRGLVAVGNTDLGGVRMVVWVDALDGG